MTHDTGQLVIVCACMYLACREDKGTIEDNCVTKTKGYLLSVNRKPYKFGIVIDTQLHIKYIV